MATPQHRELIEASIAQRSRELSPVPFAAAIDLRKQHAVTCAMPLPPLACCIVLLFAAPSLITEPDQTIAPARQ